MIKLEHVSLKYPLMQHNSHSLRAHVGHAFNRVLGKDTSTRPPIVKYIDALQDINLSLSASSRVGVIGCNGAGKTTLLRVISGIYPPSSGTIKLVGKVSALTDFTLGMDENLTGIKNIICRLIYMGFTYKEVKEHIPSIVEFSGLGEKINMPLYTYSTGMFLRLAFSISTHFRPEILVLDEIIGAGDEAFREKALRRTEKLLENSKIVVLSSHDLGAIEKYCTSAIFLDKGKIIFSGTPKEVTSEYKKFSKIYAK